MVYLQNLIAFNKKKKNYALSRNYFRINQYILFWKLYMNLIQNWFWLCL